ncbi:sigma-70 family RNA polymerase sigma factor [Candidatus Desantisbacteria bacterium]|nr:sigma-70 family RNA polymerase sigma factor [Candidatus Desantisbacteria bacterium]
MSKISSEILTQASIGDIKAFEQVYKEFSGFVYNISLKITGNSHDAEEVTQDIFMKIYHKLKTFRFCSSFKTWVYRIAVNTAINYQRSSIKKESQRVDFETIALTVSDDKATAEDNIIKQEDSAQLDSLLQALKPEHRVCLILREIEGLNYREIANILEIPVNTVRSRLKRAREALMSGRGRRKDEL